MILRKDRDIFEVRSFITGLFYFVSNNSTCDKAAFERLMRICMHLAFIL